MDEALAREASQWRSDIVAGRARPDALRTCLEGVPLRDRDAFVDAMLDLGDAPADGPDLPRNGVPYLPCGVDEVLTVVREAPLHMHDTFVDIGAGVGRVVILAHLASGARAVGVEIQSALVQAARASAAALGLGDDVSFVHADASVHALEGSLFFLYAPFGGELLRRLVARLEEEARARPFRVACVGLEIREAPSLVPRATSHPAVTIYDARPRR